MNQAGNLLSIANSPNSIINWQSFSIGAAEITRFTQQSAASAVLNRVVGAGGPIDPSVILGALQSNGRVFLINPSGIVFGAGSQIDVAGLVASSLNLSNADFLGGRLRFTETPGAGSVVNQGAINAASGGQVYLVGPSVTNSGIITSPKGEVILAAGNSVELVNPGTPNLRVEISAPDNEAKNLGSIVADAGRIGIYAGLIQHSGTARADSAVATEDGRIVLKATRNATVDAGSILSANGPSGGQVTIQSGGTTIVDGTVSATGSAGKGGSVQVLGNLVGLGDNARVDVSGETGGGKVLVGGDFQGKNPAVQNASRTYFGPNATIRADALGNGDGGTVVVWSDNVTGAYGAISARGGSQSGNGGLVEVSSHGLLDFGARVDTSAANGRTGTLLLDPGDVCIYQSNPGLCPAGTPATSNLASGGMTSIFTSSGGTL
jgi:filamentous hemagglutinin family protein